MAGMIDFREIRVRGLFGQFNVTIPIKDNRVVVVGLNGIGKSTVLNAFYYVISTQWERLKEIQFDSIEVEADHLIFVVEKKWLVGMDMQSTISEQELVKFEQHNSIIFDRGLLRIFSRLTRQELRTLLRARTSFSEIRAIANKMRIPYRVVEEIRSEINRDAIDFSWYMHSNLLEVEDYIDDTLEGRILYLPTYRRIEKDMKSIFPELDEEGQGGFRARRSPIGRRQSDLYFELVKFGMEDVHLLINNKMESLKQFVLDEIRSLSTMYLRDIIGNVIRDKTVDHDFVKIQNFDEKNLRNMFHSFDNVPLRKVDQSKIYHVVEKVKKKEGIEENERYVAHYISSLIDIWENIEERGKSVKKFVDICNSYLVKKEFKFDNLNYSLSIRYQDGESLKMEELSSGEKQIVSLFAHMILDDQAKNYFIIDEPELSLSMDWQLRFLHDISRLDSCVFVGAVTHSPFIFEGGLDNYAVDMMSCIDEGKFHEAGK